MSAARGSWRGALLQPLLGVPGAAAAQAAAMPWRQMTRPAWWGWAGISLLLMAAAAGVAFLSRQPAFVAAGLGAVLLVAWGGQVTGLLQQNDPRSSRLVPGHLRTLRRVALALWLLLVLGGALTAWAALGGRLSLPACLLVAALPPAVLAWCIRWPLLWFVLSLVSFAWVWTPPAAVAAWQGLAAWWQAHPLAGSAAAVGLLGASVCAIFGDGGAVHRQVFARQQAWRALAREGRSAGGASAFGGWGMASAWLGRPFVRTAAAFAAHQVRRARPTEASVMARAAVALHAQQHWIFHAMGVAVVLLLAASLLLSALAVFGPVPDRLWAEAWRNAQFGMSIGLANMGLNGAFLLPRALSQTRGEQALLVLLPGMPRGPALSRAVARLQLRHLLGAWLLTLATIAALFGPAAPGLAVVFTALPIGVAWVLQPPARMGFPAGWKNALPIVGYSLVGALLVAVLLMRPAQASLLLGVLAALCVLLALGLGVWRWRQWDAAPPALPAGRWA